MPRVNPAMISDFLEVAIVLFLALSGSFIFVMFVNF